MRKNAHMPPPDLLTTRQVATLLRCSVATVARMAADGRLTPAYRLEGQRGALLFRPSDVKRLARKSERVAS